MRDAHVEWWPIAQGELRAIIRYIGKDNPTRAKRSGQELRDKTKPLAQYSEPGHQGRPDLTYWLHELLVHPNYIGFFRRL